MPKKVLISVIAALTLTLTLIIAHHRPSSPTLAHRRPSSPTLARVAVTSATHIGFMAALGQLDKVVAVTNKNLIYTPLPDSVIDLGDAVSPQLELLVDAHVDAVLLCSYTGNPLESQIQRLGIRTIAINEWQETTPLARAAWIKTFGNLFGCSDRADSIYKSVADRYASLMKDLDATTKKKTTSVMTGMNFRGTWYVPSGNTYMGHLFHDAGAIYPYYNDERKASIPLSIEDCLADFAQADVWIGSEASSLEQLASMDDRHTWFKSYQTGRVYNWQAQTTPTGGNNFWERGAVHPDEILEDLIHILYDPQDNLHYALLLQ